MSTDLGTLIYTLKLDDSGFSGQLTSAKEKVSGASSGMSKSLEETEKSTNSLKGAFGSMAGQFVIGQAVFEAGQKVIETVNDLVKEGVNDYAEWQHQQQGLNAVLKSTHDAVGMNVDQLKELAETTEEHTAVEKSQVLMGENMLLTFTNIGKNAFPLATQAMVDMATRMNGGMIPNGQMLSQTAIQLGKALNDPTTGLNALHRVGVTFTDQQKQQIKTMQAAGDVYGAQKVILAELNREFGGQAQANLNTWAGFIAMSKDKVSDFIGMLIDKALPVMKKLGDWLLQNKPVLFALIGAFVGLAVAIGVAVVAALWSMVAAAVAAVVALWPIIAIGAAIGAVGYLIITNWSGIAKFFTDTWNTIANGLNWLKNHFWEVIGAVLGFFATLPVMMPVYVIMAFVAIFNYIRNINWGAVWSAIGNTFHNLWESVKTTAYNAWSWLTHLNWGAILVGIGKGIGNAIIDLVNGAIHGAFAGIPILKDHIPRLPHFAGGTNNYPGGWGVMNEMGGELVKLPSGSQIIPADKTSQMLGGKTVHFNFGPGSVNLTTAAAVREFFSMNNRSIALERSGISPLAGTTGA